MDSALQPMAMSIIIRNIALASQPCTTTDANLMSEGNGPDSLTDKENNAMEENLIRVTGSGNIHVEPDVTRIELSLTSLHDTYEDAYKQAKNDTDKLRKIMEELKLDAKLPKTIRFDIAKKTKNEYDDDGHFEREIFLGFELDHCIKIDLGMDRVLLNSVVRLIGRELKQAEISIGYTVKDPRPVQLKLLERAVKDAKEKATIMAKASGSKLGAVKHIDYSVHELYVYSQARNIHNADEAMCCEAASLDITPDDKAMSDNVTIEWYLLSDDKPAK